MWEGATVLSFREAQEESGGICIVCSGYHKKLFDKPVKKLRKIRIGAYYRGNNLRQTRKQITEVYFTEAGKRRIKYLMLDGLYEGQIRESSEEHFFWDNSPCTAQTKSKWKWWEDK